MNNIYIAADAKSQAAKQEVEAYLRTHGIKYVDLGAASPEDPRDVTDIVPVVTHRVVADGTSAILLCGNGVGVSICANRFNGIRAVLAASPEFAQWGKQYDDCNVLCLADWHTRGPALTPILDTWFSTDFDAQPRRVTRIKKMDSFT